MTAFAQALCGFLNALYRIDTAGHAGTNAREERTSRQIINEVLVDHLANEHESR